MRWSKVGCIVIVSASVLCGPTPVMAQGLAATVTIATVKEALLQALNKLNGVVATAGAEVRGSGNSLQANAQNVLVDLDRRFGGRLNATIGQLNDSERRTVNDASALATQITTAANSVTSNAGDQAVRALQQADIAAYNTLYNVPCRDQIPRIVATSPRYVRIGDQSGEVELVGNYLAFGPEPAVKVQGVTARVLGRNANALRVELPPAVLGSRREPGSVSVTVAGLTARVHRIPLCLAGPSNVARPEMKTAILVVPPMAIAISGVINGAYDDADVVTTSFHHEDADGDCDANRDSTKTFCLAEDTAYVSSTISVNSKNCNSSVSSPSAAGDRCIIVPARVARCGYDGISFIRNCKGRGWINYDVSVVGKKNKKVPYAPVPVSKSVTDGTQYSFTFNAPDSGKHTTEDWHYALNLTLSYPNRRVETIAISDVSPNAGPVTSRMQGGTLAVQLDRTAILQRGQ